MISAIFTCFGIFTPSQSFILFFLVLICVLSTLSSSSDRRKAPESASKTITFKTSDEAIQYLHSNLGSTAYVKLGLLGDRKTIQQLEINQCYRRLCKLVHPDKNPLRRTESHEAFIILREAYSCLETSEARRCYDLEINETKKQQQDVHERKSRPATEEVLREFFKQMVNEMKYKMCCPQCRKNFTVEKMVRTKLCARYCELCDEFHAAREGDLWVESGVFGWWKEFYLCRRGEILKVTQVFQCCPDARYHRIPANEHRVFMQLRFQGDFKYEDWLRSCQYEKRKGENVSKSKKKRSRERRRGRR